jgi:hypothetical protein
MCDIIATHEPRLSATMGTAPNLPLAPVTSLKIRLDYNSLNCNRQASARWRVGSVAELLFGLRQFTTAVSARVSVSVAMPVTV